MGRPRVVLVGLGVDERAKRMVAFLADCELDISLITFHGFKQNGETLLARQVEVKARPPAVTIQSTKQGNLARLDQLLDGLGIKDNFHAMGNAVKAAMEAAGSVYVWPGTAGQGFYLQDTTESGSWTQRSYLTMYVPEKQKGQVQFFLPSRTIEAVGVEQLEQVAKQAKVKLGMKSNGSGEIWLDGHKSSSDYIDALTMLGQAIMAGWKRKRDEQAQADAEEATSP